MSSPDDLIVRVPGSVTARDVAGEQGTARVFRALDGDGRGVRLCVTGVAGHVPGKPFPPDGFSFVNMSREQAVAFALAFCQVLAEAEGQDE